ncbi:gamma-glutamyl phosphate reductase [Fructobacillus pseudoficulneus]|uniref:Gamma-glutamyl phosphate reductase n=1 Tax=Fructobacillus pseudoficulneus TaxID=220714 RepID=A0A3F3H0B0_9LACO|nr:glutamate-5-semialdehyde dehydrogenase [Fructobacillus pseudoficulneus]GAP02128.1 gamma-glutamyl phosphate reductase [Fructobacillus pseudoficulneus]SEH35814.1 glutamate-5-semialdehyde dehydrogenase [Fructobacillus pseudoficulneus]
MTKLKLIGQNAKKATLEVANLTIEKRNTVLVAMAQALKDNWQTINTANQADLAAATELSGSMRNRLTLDQATIEGIAESLAAVSDLKDPLAGPYENWQHPTGFKIVKKTVPLGVVAMVYEARPNVTVDAAALTLKSGNAVILRGGKEAIHSNQALAEVLRQVLVEQGLNPDIIQLIQDTSHDSVNELLHMRDYIDVLIPRGSAKFIDFVVANATVPVIETGAGNTHIFVDESAVQNQAIDVIVNAKTQKPAVCNAAEKLLVHEKIAAEFLPKIVQALTNAGVELRGDTATRAISPSVKEASAADWDTEYNDLIMAIKVVKDTDEAISWINEHTTHHSETILSEDADHVAQFMNMVDAAVVYQNVSSRFTDGFEFGFGAEIGISTQKLHARGPMGLPALTTIKYEVFGDGQTRH